MRRSAWLLGLTAASAAGVAAHPAAAAPVLRKQVDQRGDFLWIGNTSAQECAAGARAPVVGTIGACGTQTADSAPDIFWRADSLGIGQATANNTITVANARSTAVLRAGANGLPAGATVTYARLYWGAQLATNTPDTTITLDLPGGSMATVTADTSYSVAHPTTANNYWYESTAEITTLVSALSPPTGAYRVSGIDSVNLVNLNSENPFVAWSIIFFFQDLASPTTRNLALFDGLDLVSNGNPASATLSGFLVPNAGFDAKLGVMAYEGDTVFTNDALVFNGVALTDAVNPAANFFNGSRSWMGAAVSVPGDLPQMDGLASSMSGVDLDVVDVTARVAAGQTSATIQATSAGDTYMIGAFATSISTYKPDFSGTTKTFTDLNGGGVFRNDIIEYSIVARNTGNDTALGVVLTDPLPVGVVYIPSSIRITTGANIGAKTDATGDDQGEYNAGTRTITVRLGTGANATVGGTMLTTDTTTLTFQARVDTDGPSIIANQATIVASGQRGNPITGYPTGNGSTPGTPTDTPVDECLTNVDCAAPKPLCYTTPNPNTCVVCISDPDCGAIDSGRVCSSPSQTCIDGCRGIGGNGCPVGRVCSSTTAAIGICLLPDGGLPPILDAGLDVLTDGTGGTGGTDGGDGSNDGTGGTGPDGNTDGAGGAAGTDGGGGTDGGDGAAGSAGTDGGDGAAGSAGASGRDGGDGAAGRAGAAGSGGAAGTDGGGGNAGSAGSSTGGAAGSSGAGGNAGDSGNAGAAGDSGAAGDGGAAGDDGVGGSTGTTPLPTGAIEGGGCACTTPGSPASSPLGGTTLVAALTALAAARRRKRQR
jgi:uncharacterized repeat protein (TIGR01451 family)/MYXO-CTERM domain-containing protein